ncbi:putative phage abortive infection protein [Chitinophaga sp. CF418]|uniref:putative phage abortive infection protein n=1 Tax=Chitinophaga sp. CF418 TaxID=1855287 RepID=UPI000914805B|nr:putative phage abortive infection protein [Chitinophaga sp. CF418]SHN34452.1 Putative phage abortive infection protein [Chitinophaga sp. CF418]
MKSKNKIYWFAGGIAVLTIFILTLPIWITQVDWIKKDYAATGPIGDTAGGFWGPGIGFIGAILTFVAFYVQYRANQQQREDIEQQRKDWQLERFESRFFELLRLHKENVAQMNLATGVIGRDCFYELYQEFKTLKILIDRAIQSEVQLGRHIDIDRMRLAYLIYYHGIGMELELPYFNELSSDERDIFIKLKHLTAEQKLAYKNGETNKLVYNFKYPPYEGHFGLLGVYYRHLYQTAKYITGFKHFPDDNNKYQFVGTLRDQISEFEQLMLYYNGTVLFPSDWKELFTEYRLIKNVPLDPFDTQSSPLNRYKDFMVVLWLTKKKRLFAGQKDIGEHVGRWIENNPEEFKKLKIHEYHEEYRALQKKKLVL